MSGLTISATAEVICGRRSGLNVVDRDGTRGKIDCGAANKSGESSFRHAVDACAREGGADSSVASDDNDPAAGFHFSRGCLNTDEGRTDVDRDHAMQVFAAAGIA